MKRLGVDLDDTIVDFLPDFLEFYNTQNGTRFTENQFRSYRWWETLKVSRAQAYGEAREFIRERIEVHRDDLLYGMMQIKIDPKAERALLFLGSRFECHGITDRHPDLDDDTFQTSSMLYFDELEERGLDGLVLPFDRIPETHNDAGVRYRTKAEICKQLGITRIIDDNSDIAEECLRKGIGVYMPEKPWNEAHPKSNLVFRGSWKDICRKLRNAA